MAGNNEIRGSVVRKAMMDEVANRGDHFGSALIACALIGVGEAIQRAGGEVTGALDRQLAQTKNEWRQRRA